MADRSTALLSGSLSRVVCGCWPRPSRFLTDGVSDRSLTQTQLAEAGDHCRRRAETASGENRREGGALLERNKLAGRRCGGKCSVRSNRPGQSARHPVRTVRSTHICHQVRQASRNIRGDPAGPINPRFFWPRRRMRRERGAIDMCSFHRRRGQIVSLCHSQGVHSRPPVGQINLPATDCPAVVDSSSGLWAVLLKSARHNSLPSSLSTIQTRGPSATVFAE